MQEKETLYHPTQALLDFFTITEHFDGDIKTPLNSDGMLNYQSLILPESGEDYVLDRGDNSDYSSISYRNYNY